MPRLGKFQLELNTSGYPRERALMMSNFRGVGCRGLGQGVKNPYLFISFPGGYDGEGGEGNDGDKAGMKLSLNRFFYDERWTKNRVVTSMDW